jgi:cytosine/adenosine deaminase-related metal-dependent hydrolase
MTEATMTDEAGTVVGEAAGAGTPEPCDLLVRNACVITLDEERRVFGRGAVAIRGRRIVAVGPDAEVAAGHRASRTIDAGGGIVHPGMVDSHAHVTLHTTRGGFPDSPSEAESQDFFTQWMRVVDDDDEYASTLLANLEMLRNGVTCFLEPGTVYEPDAAASAAQRIGIRGSLADPYLWDRRSGGFHDLDRAPADLARATAVLGGQLRRNHDPDALVRGHVGLYGAATASEELMVAAKAAADDYGAILTQHQSFYADDVKEDDHRFGRHPLLHLEHLGVLGPNCTFAHMNAIRDDEVSPVIDSGMTIAWVPGNYLFYGIAEFFRQRAAELYHRGVPVAPGSDVAKIWGFGEQGYIGYLLARAQGDFLAAEQVLEMGCLSGARAVGLADRLGSLAPGMLADLVIRRTDATESHPPANPVRDVALISRSKAVDTVIVDGKVVLRHGHATLVEDEEVFALADASARRLADRVALPPASLWPVR